MTLPSQLLDAYYDTDYCVFDGSTTIVLAINQHSPALQQLFQTVANPTAAFLSAYNPRSVPHPNEANELRHQNFKRRLQHDHYFFYEAVGRARHSSWQEPSVLILGIEKHDALRWGNYLEQNALLWIEADATPRLLLCDTCHH